MGYITSTGSGYPPPPPNGPEADQDLSTNRHNASTMDLTAAMSGMRISSGPMGIPKIPSADYSGSLAYQPALYQHHPIPQQYIQNNQVYSQIYNPGRSSMPNTSQSDKPPPLPPTNTRPAYQMQPTAPLPTAHDHNHVQHHPASKFPDPSQSAAPPPYSQVPPSVHWNHAVAPAQAEGSSPSQLYTSTPPLPNKPPVTSVEHRPEQYTVQSSSSQNSQQVYSSQLPYTQNPQSMYAHLSHPLKLQPHGYEQQIGTPMTFAGPPISPQTASMQFQPQKSEKKPHGVLSSTGKLGAGIVGGLATAVLVRDGKEKLEKWGKGKMNSLAGAMGYTPIPKANTTAMASAITAQKPVNRPVAQPVARPVVRPTANTVPHPPGPRPPVAATMLAGAVVGGIGGAIAANGARNSAHHDPTSSSWTTADNGTVYDQTQLGGVSYYDASFVDMSTASTTNTVGLDSMAYHESAVVDTPYGGISSAEVSVTNANSIGQDTFVSYDQTTLTDASYSMTSSTDIVVNSNATAVDSTVAYSTDGTTGTLAYDQMDPYQGTTYIETNYSVESSSSAAGTEITYTSETEVYVEPESVTEVASSGGGGSWLDTLGLSSSSWTDSSTWGLDSGDACLDLI